MAKEVVKKEVRTETKKKGRRLKRSVRKTLGALFMATAIAVAAIPVDYLQAEDTEVTDADWGTLEKNMPGKSKIPEVKEGDPIYSTGDGTFQFAHVAPDGGSGNKVAVILGYNKLGSLPGGNLSVPNTVDAYARRSDNLGTGNGYTAIGKMGNFLYYKDDVTEQLKDPDTKELLYEDEEKTKPKMGIVTYYRPCDYESRTFWHNLKMEDFYYYEDNDPTKGDPKPTNELDYQWNKDITVVYIGNQYLESTDDGGWDVAGTVTWKDRETKGVFSRAANIENLTFGEDMSGIGDYAFYGCTNLKSITLNNGLNTIGVGAFAECINMWQANIDVHAFINVIGDYAFYNCRALSTFTLPNAVVQVGNSAFEKCEAMTSFIMGYVNDQKVEENGSLEKLGARAFKGCKSLKNITFQSQFTEEVPLSTFAGCSALEYIEVKNNIIDFKEDSETSYADFKTTVLSTFYFKGPETAALHDRATKNQVPYSYYDSTLERDIYELTVTEGSRKVVYRVDKDDNLVFCGSGDRDNPDLPETVNLPENIGPYHIKVIDSQTFQNRCELKSLSIPYSITGIEAEAFKGCHQLKWVVFENPNPDLTIGEHAFQTQEGVCTKSGAGHTPPVTSPASPELNFVGPISYSSEPFDYAMRPEEAFDNGNQPTTYIKYYALWPSLIVVQYNPEKDENELIDYPTLTEMASGNKYTGTALPYLNQKPVGSEYTRAGVIVEAMRKYEENIKENKDGLTGMSSDEKDVVNAAINLVLPEGVEGIWKDKDTKKSLFVDYENLEGESSYASVEKTITAESIINIDEDAFEGHKNLTKITFSDATRSVGTHAFEGCEKLVSVSLPGTVEKMGTRPFAGCEKLSTVSFGGGPYFTCDSGIIYELSVSGAKNKLVEFLEGRRTSVVSAKEVEGITELYPEAFMGTNVTIVDLSTTRINKVPTKAFYDTSELSWLVLPVTMEGGTIVDGAFAKSNISTITIPGMFTNMTERAFGEGDEVADHFKDQTLVIIGEKGSMAEQFASENHLEFTDEVFDKEYRVRFFWRDDNRKDHQIGEDQWVKTTQSAVAPSEDEVPQKDGYTFAGFYPDDWKYITDHHVDAIAEYDPVTEEPLIVVFQDYNGKELSSQKVQRGRSAIVPQSPSRMDEDPPWVFDGWVLSGGNGEFLTQQSPSLMNVQSDMVLIAQYHMAKDGETVDPGTGKTPSPNPGTSGSPNPGASGSPNPGTSGSPGPGGTLYTLTVQNGSGSGSYVEGAQAVIVANDPATGQMFDYWSVSPDDVKIASTVLSASVITMPAKDVTVTAHFKAGNGNSSSGGGGTVSGNNAQRPNGSVESVSNGGTTVVIDKNGLSNTGVVSATVHGSSDDFVIKITDTAEATEAALRALMAEYGDDLTNIRYFPMDISLYDSTGTYKITDTTGLSVDVTIPLPDSMITYAGNNRVASTSGSRLERLDARFSTIQGVSCVTFTAEHFSPYMIYVDLGNLSSGFVSDNTPQTGDGIHPKWFLSIGLACLSLVFFMQKDGKKQPKKAKVKVRAR